MWFTPYTLHFTQLFSHTQKKKKRKNKKKKGSEVGYWSLTEWTTGRQSVNFQITGIEATLNILGPKETTKMSYFYKWVRLTDVLN